MIHTSERESMPEPVTVVVPAHDERDRIEPCLRCLATQRFAGDLRVVVVANACSDGTRDFVAALWPTLGTRHRLHVLEIDTHGKASALNAGDRAALSGVRVYLDADVEIAPTTVARLEATLRSGTGVHMAAPRKAISPPRSSISRGYARVWSQLPFVADGVSGTGIYAVSREGRTRWSEFPHIHSDDKFITSHFAPHERRILHDCHAAVCIPEGLAALLRARVRWCRGTLDYRDLFGDGAEVDRYASALRSVIRAPSLWPSLPIFLGVYVPAALLARLTPRSVPAWSHHDTVRESVPELARRGFAELSPSRSRSARSRPPRGADRAAR